MKYIYAVIIGLVTAVLIFWGGMSYNQYKIDTAPAVISIDTTNHSFNIPLKDTIKIPVTVYKPDQNRKKYIDSLISERMTADSLRNFIMTKLSLFGEVFTDSTEVKDSIGTFKQIHIFDILADPLFSSIRKTDIKNQISFSSYDTTKSTYITKEPTIWQRIQDVGILGGIIAIIYFLATAL
jgi:hypothetical protein